MATAGFDPPVGRKVIATPVYLSLKSSAEETFIGSIELAPDYQGRGIGSAIFEQLIEHSETGNQTLSLQVLKINHRARALYQRLGFSVTGHTEHHLQMERSVA